MKILADQMNFSEHKRKRTVLTARQHQLLMKAFDECAFPDSDRRNILGRTLNMSPRTVQIWFQNQRQKTKNTTSETKSSELEDESIENVVNTRKAGTPSKSLLALADAACKEYEKRCLQKRNKM